MAQAALPLRNRKLTAVLCSSNCAGCPYDICTVYAVHACALQQVRGLLYSWKADHALSHYQIESYRPRSSGRAYVGILCAPGSEADSQKQYCNDRSCSGDRGKTFRQGIHIPRSAQSGEGTVCPQQHKDSKRVFPFRGRGWNIRLKDRPEILLAAVLQIRDDHHCRNGSDMALICL